MRPKDDLRTTLGTSVADLGKARETFTPTLSSRETGLVLSVSSGIAKVSGLPSVGFEELVKFPGDLLGIVFNVDEVELGVVLLGDYAHLAGGGRS
jgi:F-type H+/Na+-transporting ATPase subunit alpha